LTGSQDLSVSGDHKIKIILSSSIAGMILTFFSIFDIFLIIYFIQFTYLKKWILQWRPWDWSVIVLEVARLSTTTQKRNYGCLESLR